MCIGHDRADWGMEDWYRQQDEADAMFEAEENNAHVHLDDCIAIAKRLAPEYYNANGEDYYESDEEFLADGDCWTEWLIDDCGSNSLKQAMKFWIERQEDFTKPEWILEQVKK